MQLLLIKINSINANPEYALLGKNQKEYSFTLGKWNEVRSLTRGRRVLLIISNDDVVLTSVKIPSKNKKQLLKAIPFALEDQLAEDIEDLHFSIHQENDGGTQAAIINRNLLDSYILLLRKNGITLHFILPQILIQTIKKNAWSIVQKDDDSISVRLNDYSGFSCDKSLLETFIQQLEIPESKIVLSNMSVEKLPEVLQDFQHEDIELKKVFYESATSALSLNLLNNFISQKTQSSFNWKAWKPTIIIASVIVATWIGILGWQNTLLQKQRSQLKQSIETIFTSTFPKSRIVDPPQQMASKLAQLKKNTGTVISSPLPLIADIGPLLKKYSDVTLRKISYKENKLELVVQAPNLTHLEKFKKDAIKESRLQVDIISSTTTADKVEAILLISPLKLSKLDQEKA